LGKRRQQLQRAIGLSLVTVLYSVVLILGPFGGATAKEFIFGMAPGIPDTSRASVVNLLVRFVTQDAKPNDSIVVVDAFNNQRITEMKIPAASTAKNEAQRLDYLKSEFAALVRFLRRKDQATHSVKIPQFLDYVTSNLRRGTEAFEIVILGNPLYQDAKEQQFSMGPNLVPSDAHLNVDREKSVYGLKDRRGRLLNARVHIGYWDVDWVSDLHRLRIHRFWSLFISGQGGTLATFDGDLQSAFANSLLPPSPPADVFSLSEVITKLEMLEIRRAREAAVVTAILAPLELPAASEATAPLLEKVPIPTIVGIKWDCKNCDLDLYAKASPKAEWLNFAQIETSEGRYFKYAGDAAQPIDGVEYVEFNNTINPSDIVIAINFYEGKAPGGPQGIVRISVGNRLYQKPFAIRAEQGNKGLDERSLLNSPYWAVIKASDVIGVAASSK
jgi:hypothetical protein